MRDHTDQVSQLHSAANPNLQMLLSRLEHVEQRGEQYRAKCPVHGGKSRSSLSVRETGDGRILIHCFGGCDALEVVNVCGLEMIDLMPERMTHNATPEEKRKWHESSTIRDWENAQASIQHEARVVWVAGKQIKDGKKLNDVDDQRLDEALEQIAIQGRKLNVR